MAFTGAQVIALALKNLGVEVVFGLVGIPVIEIADALQDVGVKFIAFRNEQAASYAASVYGYLTDKPGVLLVVGGPGIVHGLAGLLNSASNHWPLLVLAGSIESSVRYKGGFQELDQLEVVQTFSKFSCKPSNVVHVPRLVAKSYRLALAGQPGCTYVDLPGDLIQCVCSDDELQELKSEPNYTNSCILLKSLIPKSAADTVNVQKALETIKKAKFPLLIVGKGAVDASGQIREFVDRFKIPFIPTPMGKGVVSDHSSYNVSSARSLALQSADVVILAGARLNWIMHFGGFGEKFSSDVKFIQINHSSEQIGENYSLEDVPLGLVGDIKVIFSQFLASKALQHYQYGSIPTEIRQKILSNNNKIAAKENTIKNGQLNYYVAYKTIREFLKQSSYNNETILISEGANTMDISRVSFPMVFPKQRLDAGTNSTMGVGLGYSIAAKIASPEKHVLAIEGDSAFGFSGMEFETAVRYKLGIIVVVMNNSGIYHGVVHTDKSSNVKKPIELSHETRYDQLAESLGGDGYFVKTTQDLQEALNRSFHRAAHLKRSSLINIIIEPGEQKKIAFKWQNQPNKKSKL